MKTHVVVIDPQNDFCHPHGALFVPGASEDIIRLGQFLQKNSIHIDALSITLDSHQYIHIAHPNFWKNKDGISPAPFTLIQLKDISGEAPKWSTRLPKYEETAKQYIQALEKNKRYTLCIWPAHCLIGSWGHNINEDLLKTIHVFEQTFKPTHYIFKGTHPFTEHYSTLRAEVPDPKAPETQLNKLFFNSLQGAERILIAGEALSHCLANTIVDLLEVAGEAFAKKITLLKDCCSSVPGFEQSTENFLKRFQRAGGTLCNSKDISF